MENRIFRFCGVILVGASFGESIIEWSLVPVAVMGVVLGFGLIASELYDLGLLGQRSRKPMINSQKSPVKLLSDDEGGSN